jgi:hypothetical protein
MAALLPVLVIVSFLLIKAHFIRSADWILAALFFAFPLLLLIPRKWAARTVQGALMLATAEWARTAVVIAQERLSSGQPYGRMILILGTVALITFVSACLFFLPAMKKRYPPLIFRGRRTNDFSSCSSPCRFRPLCFYATFPLAACCVLSGKLSGCLIVI